MTSRVSSSKFVLVAAFVLLVVVAVTLRLTAPRETSTQTGANGSIPEFASTTFVDGDVLKGLGPEWTYLRQSRIEAGDARALPGLTPDRESVVKLLGQPVEMTLSEYDIEDQEAFDLAIFTHVTSTVGTRTGYIVPLNDIAGGEGFLLVGTRSVLLISLAGSAKWPSIVPEAVVTFISAIRVP